MRKLTYSMDGETINYSPLTVAEAREFSKCMKEIRENRPNLSDEQFIQRVDDAFNNMVLMALNKQVNGDKPWTIEKLNDTFDGLFLENLWNEVLKQSRMKMGSTPGGSGSELDFIRLIARTVTVTGWTLEYVNALPMDEAMDLQDYWNDNPPAHELMLAAWFETKKKRRMEGSFSELAGTPQLQGIAGDARKLSDAPAHIRASIEQLKKAKPNA